MSPEASAVSATVARLLEEIRGDREAMERHRRELDGLLQRWHEVGTQRPYAALAAMSLHGWYTALESAMERVARAIDREVPSGPRSHAELLSQLAAEIPTVRPAVLRRALLPDLVALLAFRHFFRHAYAVELDPVRLEREGRRLLQLAPEIRSDLDSYERFLGEVLRKLVAGSSGSPP